MRIYLSIILIVSSFLAFGQSKTNYEHVNEAFGEMYAEELAKSNPKKLEYLTKYAETGFIVLNGNIKTKNVIEIDVIPLREKGETINIDEFVYILQNESYNPLTFEWTPGIQPRVYKLAETKYFICVPSQQQLERI